MSEHRRSSSAENDDSKTGHSSFSGESNGISPRHREHGSDVTPDKSRKRNFVTSLLRKSTAGLKKLSRRGTGANEETPLLDITATNTGSGSGSPSKNVNRYGLDRFMKSREDLEAPRAKDYWKILKNHIQDGDFLLRNVNTDNVNDRARQLDNKREHEIQETIDEIRQGMEFSAWHCLAAILVYLAISVVCFNFFFEPEWTVLDCCYFAMVTVTTVGYGDEVPSTAASRLFTCLYALTGIAILGIALGVLGSHLVDAQEAVAGRAEDLLKYQVLSVFDDKDENHVQTIDDNEMEEDEDDLRRPSFYRSAFACLKGFVPLTALMFGLAWWIGYQDGWSLTDTIYFMIVTATTVGYGDFTAQSDTEKLVSLFFIPIAVGAMGVWLGGFANIILESRSARFRRDLGLKELTQHDLKIMDRDNDGTVTRAEFLEFMLVAMNKIDQDLVEELRQHFNRLDVDGTGELTKQDLIEIARRKLRSPAHKLRLSLYKQRLLAHARSRENIWPNFGNHSTTNDRRADQPVWKKINVIRHFWR